MSEWRVKDGKEFIWMAILFILLGFAIGWGIANDRRGNDVCNFVRQEYAQELRFQGLSQNTNNMIIYLQGLVVSECGKLP